MTRRRRRPGALPNPRNHRIAELAPAARQVIGRNDISLPFDQQLLAIMTIGVVALVPGHVAHVNVANTHLHGHLAVATQG